MKIGIIGAGPAGLVALKYALDEGYECDAFEQTGELGGTWVYTDNINVDENGIAVHSSMYKGMRTNLPKEIMSFRDFPYPEAMVTSYINQEQVLEYFKNYANAFNLNKHIKYFHCVTHVNPIPSSKWSVTVTKLKSGVEKTYVYDSIFVCNGHYSIPRISEFPNQNSYKGMQIHSHHYRTSEPFRNKRVLVVGAGFSGTDIAAKLSEVAKHVFLSFRYKPKVNFHKKFTGKPVVAQLFQNGAIFQDGSKEEVDAILYCTGYTYNYPFLSEACEIFVLDNWVQPLYKHIVNAKHPTMYFIGIPSVVPVMPVCDIQVRFALALLKKKFLPTVEFMLQELKTFVEDKRVNSIPSHHYHKIGSDNVEKYFLELSDIANIPRVPPVISKLYSRVRMNRNLEDCFKIIDDENFIQLNC